MAKLSIEKWSFWYENDHFAGKILPCNDVGIEDIKFGQILGGEFGHKL